MQHLIYTDAAPNPPGSALPLPEGWPAADHDEPDAAIAKVKIASGSYRKETEAAVEVPEEKPKRKRANRKKDGA